MLQVGITGGIGAGKTIVCHVFEALGIPVFYADDVARELMEHDITLAKQISAQFGDDIYANGVLNRKRLASIVFSDADKLQVLNKIIHPLAIRQARAWRSALTGVPYAIKESAIFFESGSQVEMDLMIGISAPKQKRIARAMKRMNGTREAVVQRMLRQMDEDKKMNMCDFVIVNDDSNALLSQILAIHSTLLLRSANLRG